MKTPEEIGKIVRRLRGSLSLRDFANKCGVSHSTIDYIEKGYDFRTGKPTYPSAVVLSKIAAAAQVPLDYILGVNTAEDSTTPTDEFVLNDGEKALVKLFRLASPYQREIILQLLAAKITPKE